MSHLIRKSLLWCLPLFALFASCSEDFKVGAPYKLITVAYGLMNMDDTAHYIRIQKAYYDENASAIDLVANASDSLFYAPNTITVTLREVTSGIITANEVLQRVDLNAEGYRKDSGVFYSKPNYAYKTKRALNPDPAIRYRLVLENAVSGEKDSAETPVVASNFVVYDFNQTAVISFPAVRDNNNFTITVKVPPSAQFFEGIITFHWVDKSAAGVQTDHSADWKFASAPRIEGKDALVLTVSQRAFYSFLREAIGAAPSGVTRFLDSSDVTVWAGSPEFYTFQQINGAQGGLTADQIKPIYTNWKGQNIYGLFASRAMRMQRQIPIDNASLDSLINNEATKVLNFRGRSDH